MQNLSESGIKEVPDHVFIKFKMKTKFVATVASSDLNCDLYGTGY